MLSRAARFLQCVHVRPFAPAHRVLHRRRHQPHRRNHQDGGGRPSARAGHHRPEQPVRRHQVLQGGPRCRRQADHRRRNPAAGPGQGRHRAVAHGGPGAEQAGLPQPVRAAGARLDQQRREGAGRLQARMAARVWPGPDRALGGPGRPGGPGPRAGRSPTRGRRGAGAGFHLSASLLHRAAAWRPARRRSACRRRRAAGRATQPAGGGHASGAVHHRGRLRGARGAGLHLRRRNPGQPAPRSQVHARAILQAPGPDGAVVRRRALGPGQHARDRQTLQPGAGTGQAQAAGLPHAERDADRRILPLRLARGLEGADAPPLPGRGAARQGDAALRAAPGVRDQHHPEDGVPGLLPHRGRLHQLGQEQRLPGGAGAGFRRRVAGGLFAQDHRPRSAAVQPAVRAFPQPRAGVDARLRHRLLPVQPRPRHRLRQGQVRQGGREPDRDLRHHGGARGHPRRGPGAGHELHLLRRHQQADPQQAGPAHHDRRCHRGRACPGGAAAARGRGQDLARAGAKAGRPHPQRRHARGWRADRAGQADRLHAALPAAGQRLGREPVRQGRRGGRRPGEVRLSGPGDPHHPGDRQGLHPRAPQGPGRVCVREHPARRRAHVQAVHRRQDRGGVPV